jgi:hypothetical protein
MGAQAGGPRRVRPGRGEGLRRTARGATRRGLRRGARGRADV